MHHTFDKYHDRSILRSNMKYKIIIAITVACLLAASAVAGGLSSARAVAMGDAQMGLAKGVYAPLFNPANIALSGYGQAGVEIAGVGAEIFNNSFSLSDYNGYTGAVLSNADKSAILGKIPIEGLELSARVQASAMTISLGSFVISTNGVAASEINLSKDIIELLLNGNQLNDTLSLDEMYSEAIAYATVGLTAGKTLYKSGTRQLTIGATYKYIRGLAYEDIVRINGEASTTMSGFGGSGMVVARTATGGTGYAIDFGAALKLSDNHTAGISFSNLFNGITWNKQTEEHYYSFRLDTLTIDNMDNDSVFVSDDYSQEIGDFKSNIPTVMRIGLADISGKFLWAADWEQGFKLGAGVSSKPRLSFGGEYRLIGFLPFRAGYSLGGGKGSTVSFGTGLDLSLYYLDVAATNHGSIASGSSKGIHLALSTGLRF
jgi:hypothetical protein